MAISRIQDNFAQLQAEIHNCEETLLKLIKDKKIMSAQAMDNVKINKLLQQTPVAIIGMASIFPQSKNLQEYWEKIIHKIDCITEVPPSRWNIDDYYDPDPKAPDKTYCKRGGFIPDIEFNPMEFGLPPNLLEVTDISQLLGLIVAKAALQDAGYGEGKLFNREQTGVILGVALARQLSMPLASRLEYPLWKKVLKSSGLSDEDTQKIIEKIKSAYVQWEENAFPGMLANIVAGRIANRLDLGGINCVIDAACASSLAALAMSISELVEHRADMMLTGGVDTDNSIVAYMCFSKTPAVSPSQNVKPFDAGSDGMMLAEGVGMLVLKRLEDAIRDNDRIYAVIKGIGTSSDGRYKSIYAPRPEGQIKAMRRAYEDAGFSPTNVGLIEAHGTGTMVGDPAEVTAIKEVFSENNPKLQYIALGSVKSQIGHTKAAAGAASLIKTALALHHKVLPPTINVTKPHPKLNLEASPLYLNTETRPWICAQKDLPRRAGVSSFGFGGTNYHVVLEEYTNEHDRPYRLHNVPQSVLLFAPTPEQILSRSQEILNQLESPEGERHYAELIAACQSAEIPVTNTRVGFVADSLAEACKLLQITISLLKDQPQAESWEHPQGIYYRKTGMTAEKKVVALFSGQGSQYLEMGRELVINFPCLRQSYSYLDHLFCKDGLKPLSEVVFPPPVFNTDQKQAQVEALQHTEYAQPAIGAFSVGLYKIFQQAGFKPDFVAGHSFGELTALWAAGALSDEDYFFLVKARGQAMAAPNDSQFDAGAMLAIKGDVNQVEELLKNDPQVSIANWNSPRQVVLAGAKAAIAQVQEQLTEQGYSTVLLPVSAAFHTTLVAHAQKPFTQAIEEVIFHKPKIPVYTNVTGETYPSEPQAIQKILKQHLINRVLFQREIENIYAQGGYCFIEFGPKSILTNLVKDILIDRPHLAVALNRSHQKDSDRCLREAFVQLRVVGLPLSNLDPYQLEQKTPEVAKNKLLTVQLNSTNYVSEKTKKAFEKALQNGHLVCVEQAKDISSRVERISTLSPQENDKISISQQTNTVQNRPVVVTNSHKQAKSSNLMTSSPENFEPKQQINPEILQNYQLSLDSLEYILIEFNRHQRDVLSVHEQSLKYQTEYVKTFFDLMQQQNLLLSENKFFVQQSETKQIAFSNLQRSMMRFHEHHTETLRVHESYLTQQTEHTKNFFQLLQQHYDLLLTSLNTKDSTRFLPKTAPLTNTQDSSISQFLVVNGNTKSAAKNGNKFITNVEPILSNGSSNGSSHGSKSVAVITSDEPIVPSSNLPLKPIVIDEVALSQALLNVVSDKTGYPVEMLELSMDMEADLGIDSIKRVEILGGLLELYPDLPKPNPEELGVLRTLGQVLEYMQTCVPSIPQVESAPMKTAEEATLDTVNISKDNDQENHNLPTYSPSPILTTAPSLTEKDSPVSSVDITDSSQISQILLNVVSEKTGYPVEMLELSMDMEADLGIDSIKRVEILGGLLELCPDLPKPNPEELGVLRTLGQIVDYIKQQAETLEKKTFLAEPSSQSTEAIHNINHNTFRSLVQLKSLPEPDVLDFSLPEKHIALITDDGSLTTSKLALALLERGWKVVVLSFPQNLIAQQASLPERVNQVVLADLSEQHLKQQLEQIATQYGPIAVFIHLNPVIQDSANNCVCYPEAEKILLRHLFLMAKYLKEPLNQAASQGVSRLLTVARLDGEFGLGHTVNFGAISGGLFGLTKTLNQEWEPVFCRAIDLSPDLDEQTSVRYILAELFDPNQLITEVGYGSQGRTTLICEKETTKKEFRPPVVSLPSQVFLVSGGAKGITAQCVIKLARYYQCKFILLGRSPVEPEPVWAKNCSNEGELKKQIMEDFLARGEKPTIAMVQSKFQTISSNRKIQATLQAIEQAGGTAEYLSVDITDGTLVQQKVAAAVERLGQVTGIIHGAGNLADKRIENKTEQDFETVYGAKVKGLENLLSCVSPHQLNYLVLFSSVVGFYGNVGQADYAIANEILNKSAHLIKRNYPGCHVVAINWGPWDSGMVSPELKKAFTERGIETIPVDVGTQMLVDELADANQESVQVVIGSPLIYKPTNLSRELKTFHIQRRLTLAANPFLQDHVIAGHPVLPATCAMSWIINTCEQLYPGYKFFSFENFKVLKGIVFDGKQANEYILNLEEITKNLPHEIEFNAKIFSKKSSKLRYHFSASIKLKDQIPVPPIYESFNLSQEQIILSHCQHFYQNGVASLFHGPCFQGVRNVLNATSRKITIECNLPPIHQNQQGQFLVQTFNPYIVDVYIHALWIWSQNFYQEACLPSEVGFFEHFLPIPFGETFYVSCEIKSKTDSSLVTDVIAHNHQGQIYSRMMGAKGTILPININNKV